jgi:hypothetical protein
MLRNDLYLPWFADKEQWGFEVISGEFMNTVIQIEKLEFGEKDGEIALDFHVIKRSDILEEDDYKKPIFQETVELIINDILQEAVQGYEQDRNDNPTKSSS